MYLLDRSSFITVPICWLLHASRDILGPEGENVKCWKVGLHILEEKKKTINKQMMETGSCIYLGRCVIDEEDNGTVKNRGEKGKGMGGLSWNSG